MAEKAKKKWSFGKMLLWALLILVLAGVIHTVLYTKKWEKAHPPTGSFKTVDGQKIHYLDLNTANGSVLTPIVLIHGASAEALA